ncbi:MAG: ParB N-terminal domain-containing protein [Thermoleophilaceae bacterium]
MTGGMTGRGPTEPIEAGDCRIVEALEHFIGRDACDRFVARCVEAVSPLYDGASPRLQSTPVRETYPLIRSLDSGRLDRAEKLLAEMRRRGLAPFAPMIIAQKPRNDAWVILPPVLERHALRTYVINGHHRLFAARSQGVKKVQAIVIHGVSEHAPASALRWREVQVSHAPPRDRNQTADDLKPDLVRPVASFLRSGYFCFASVDAAVRWCQWFAASTDRWLWDAESERLRPRLPAPR